MLRQPLLTDANIILGPLELKDAPSSVRLDGANHAAIFEIDSQKHFIEAALAEEAIQRRRSELVQSSANCDELIAIARALLVLKQVHGGACQARIRENWFQPPSRKATILRSRTDRGS